MTTPTIEVASRVRVAGFHHWPDAPTHRAYLGSLHRHEFHVEVSLHVHHGNRAIEFHDLRDAIYEGLALVADDHANGQYDFGPRSCEHIGCLLASAVANVLTLPDGSGYKVSVFEDGECGAIVTGSLP